MKIICLSIALSVLFCFAKALAQEETTEPWVKKVDALLAQKAYSEAEAMLLPLQNTGSRKALELLGIVYEFQLRYSDALGTFKKAFSLEQANMNRDDLRVLNDLYHLEENSMILGDSKQAEDYLEQEKVLYEKIKGQPIEQILSSENPCRTLYQMGRVALFNRELVSGQSYLTKALKLADAQGQPKTLILHGLALFTQVNGQLSESEAYYQKAISEMSADKTLPALKRAKIFFNLATFYFFQGKSDMAKQYYSQSYAEAQNQNRLDIVPMQVIYMMSILSKISSNKTFLTEEYLKAPIALNPKSKEILIHIQRGDTLTGWKPEYDDMIMKAFEAWNQNLDHPFSFKLTQDPKKYDIQITWRQKAQKTLNINLTESPWWTNENFVEKAGQNISVVRSDGLIVRDDIEIILLDSEGHARSDLDMYGIILHEVGHALGLKPHSTNPGDVMYGGYPEGLYKTTLSARDIASLKALYAVNPRYTNPTNQRISDLYRQSGMREAEISF